MTGIDKIIARIETDANAEIQAIKDASTRACDETRLRYEKAAQEEYWKAARAGVKDTEFRVLRLAGIAEMESKKSILALKQEMVEAAFERAGEIVLALPPADYVAFLAKLAANSAAGYEELIFNERDRDSHGRNVAKAANELLKARGVHGGLTVSGEVREISGGLIIKHGDIEVNCSVEALIRAYRSELATPVAEIMFD